MAATLSHPDYPACLTALKARILAARTLAARAVNHELVLLYWDIGRGIVEKQQAAGWGDAVVERLAADLRAEFPDMRGFSARSIWEMKRLYLAWSDPEFLQQAVAELRRKSAHPGFLRQAVAELETRTQTASKSLLKKADESEILEQTVQVRLLLRRPPIPPRPRPQAILRHSSLALSHCHRFVSAVPAVSPLRPPINHQLSTFNFRCKPLRFPKLHGKGK